MRRLRHLPLGLMLLVAGLGFTGCLPSAPDRPHLSDLPGVGMVRSLPVFSEAPTLPVVDADVSVEDGYENETSVGTAWTSDAVNDPTSLIGWLKNERETALWSGSSWAAGAFTDLPIGSVLRVQGAPVDGRWPVTYVGDGLYRRSGGGWVDGEAVVPVDPPAPGESAEVDAYVKQQLPDWVQAHHATSLLSGPDSAAVVLTELPQWTYLRILGLRREGRLLVSYAGDYATREPGIGWVDEGAVGPADEPGLWVQSYRKTELWSGTDEKSMRFTDLPQWTKMRIFLAPQPGTGRLLVEFFGDNTSRTPGLAWVPVEDVGPITPPTPVPARPVASAPSPAGAAPSNPARSIAANGFASEADFLQQVGTAAQVSSRRTGVPVSVTLAQAILESDWGRSRLSRQANNLFGMKALGAPGPAGSVTFPTWEHLDGEDVMVEAPFRAYNSLEESVQDHDNLFARNRRYAPAMALRDDPKRFAEAIHAAGYATDPAYSSKLIRLMDRYDLSRFDVAKTTP